MSLSGIFSALSMKKGKSRRKKGQDTSSGEDASPSHSPAPSEREGKQQKRKGGAKSSLFGSSSSAKQQQQPQQQKQQESAGSSTGGRVEVPPDRAERTPWGKVTAKKDAGAKKGKKGTGYYESNGISIPSLQSSAGSKRDEAKLDQMFDELRDPEKDAENEMGVESLMKYFATLGVNPETCEIFIVLDIVQATSFGLVTRKGFVEGWKATGVSPSITAHKKHIKDLTKSLSTDPAYFKKVYRAAFTAGKEPDQKALGLDHALVYWDMIFSPPGMAWETATTDWLAEWKEFLGQKWTRSVNKDMWNQTLEFALKSMEDESLGFWSEDAAWPGVIDEFVLWCRENKRGGVMEVDS